MQIQFQSWCSTHLKFSDEIHVSVSTKDESHPFSEDIIEFLVGDQPGRVEGQGERSLVGAVVALKVLLEKSLELFPRKIKAR